MIKIFLLLLIMIGTGIFHFLLNDDYARYEEIYKDKESKSPTSLRHYINNHAKLNIENKEQIKINKIILYKNSSFNLVDIKRSNIAINKIDRMKRKRIIINDYLLDGFLSFTSLFECKTKQIKYDEILYSLRNDKSTKKIKIEIKTNKKNPIIEKTEILIYKNIKNKKTPYDIEISEYKNSKIINEYKCKMNNESSLIKNLSKLIKKIQEK